MTHKSQLIAMFQSAKVRFVEVKGAEGTVVETRTHQGWGTGNYNCVRYFFNHEGALIDRGVSSHGCNECLESGEDAEDDEHLFEDSL
jgi:hypothetical protein